MKTKLVTLVAGLGFASFASAAISISGTALKNVQGATTADLVAGRLGLLIVDTAGDGFLNGGGNAAIATANPISSRTYTESGANLALNSTFFGDLILARLTTSVAFSDTTISGNFSGELIGGGPPAFDFTGKNYAIVWFNTLTTAGQETVASGAFGIARGGDWTFPAANSGNQTFGTAAANLDQLTLGAVATAPAGQSVAFATNGTSFSIIPEPSAVVLGVIGALGLLRRRRN